MHDPRLDSLRSALPGLRLATEPDELLHYGRDWTRRWTPAPLAVALPGDTREVQAVLRWASDEGVPVVPSGGRTGLSGGAVAANGELVLSLERMRRVLAFDPVDRSLTVEAGTPLEAVQEAARAHGLQYPVDFAARGSCTIGGNIATNAGGIRVLRYGNTREWVAGLKLVTAAGELLDLNRGLVKNSSGYDLRHLAIASEGTLGVVVEATLRLAPPPPPVATLLLALPSFDVLMQVFQALRERLSLEAFEFFTDVALRHVLAHGAQAPFDTGHPYYVVVDAAAVGPDDPHLLDAFAHCAEQGWVEDGVVAQSQAQALQLWRLREGITEALAPHLPYKNDVAVRVSAMPAFIAEAQALLSAHYPGFEVAWFGHIGDGNLHINVLKPAALEQDAFVERCGAVTAHLAGLVERHAGTISAEHGIGLVKKPYLGCTRSAAEIAVMRAVRAALDPAGILNPGKLFDPPSR
ncbi:FAD-binding oxidoreductase [Luteimonas sp. MC1750]|uniref:FAD-binding oxidoreductase n=1 Tax=Luteimonas sp. MC1750 TaxID=2799326 RepID=UPI0018F05E87|nr:FAD-binding oxidoreductase [Luteimonas sp. MC1750]MBJ6984306.1 FAD-binding oxidoreductase [Luteimonas sp. MC1750]QQO05070.1 FAD-binding oxidoreductase [Luteimonas sp. MC1750]